ncbi:EamA family transporter [Agromyces cerinus]|uniref:EamA-like transporter family protein n=1 Tax=Agromyces cerinus subsp. cerinus TaxID=232089 RepID=A0A1N6F4W8_9MICO|nr:EamA family transporter [Agromyces cerinus]SIN90332.1 EamA-like transporter family protein [Agromyces cerinus subsp. cerinus]
MLTAVLSLTGAFVFGAADFLGGLAAKRIGAVLATAVASVAGFIGLAVATPLSGGVWTAADLWWGAAAGVAGAVAIGLLYACLAIGPMSILSPLTAVVSAIVPMLWGLATGARLGPLAPWALGLALVAVVLVGFVPERGAVRPSLTGIAMGIGSGTAIGAFFILIDRTSDESGLAPLAVNSAVTAVVMFAVVGGLALRARAKRSRMPRADESTDALDARDRARGIRLAVVGGLVNAAANALILFGIRAGELAIAAVLGAMYPAGTILLAAIVLRERIAPVQWAGLVLALAAAAMLAVS